MTEPLSLNRFTNFIRNQAKQLAALSLLALSLTPAFTHAQQSYTFTACGATGLNGPSQGQANTAYGSTNLSNSVVVTGGIQSFTVPLSGSYRIEAYGASGGNNAGGSYVMIGGKGVKMQGDFNLTAGDVLKILVGQKGTDGTGTGGGGGGSYVTSNSVLLIVAGGGGGPSSDVNGVNGVTGTAGTQDNPASSLGGTNGNGGGACSGTSFNAGGGGGYNSGSAGNGANASGGANGGFSFLNGGTGGTGNSNGGFGGGGGASSITVGGGGGGGYSGGAGGMLGLSPCTPGLRSGGGGGGSYNNGTNQVNTAGVNTGDGKVVITALCNINLTSASSSGPGPICTGNTVTLTTNAISNYSWSTGATTSSIVLSPTITTSYTLTATSPSNCTASSVITVTVDNTPTVTAVSNPTAVCAGKSITLTASGATTYTWTNGSSNVPNGVGFIPASTSNYTVTGTNACGSSSKTLAVVVNTLPVIGGAANNPTVCNGSSVILNGTGSASGYTWTNGVTNNVAFTPGFTDSYTVTGISAQGCTNTAVVGVTVYVTPTVAPVASPTAICLGQTATLTATGATSGYTWSTVPASNASVVTVSPNTTTTYTVVRLSSACSSTSTVTVTVNGLPTLIVNPPTPTVICAGQSATLSANGAISYVWYPGGFPGSNVTVYPNGNTQYTVVASNANCTTQAVSNVSVNANPVVTITAMTSSVICNGESATLTANGANTYTWLTIPNQMQQTIVVTPTAATLYSVSATNGAGCTSVQGQVILVRSSPSITTSVVNAGGYICAGSIGTLAVTSSSPAQTAYNWNTGATGSSFTVNPTTNTGYTVTATDINSNCKTVGTVTLSVYISTFVVTSPTAICKGSVATLSASGAASSYTWNTGSTSTAASNITVSPVATSNYTVTGTTGNCSNVQTLTLVVNSIPNVGAQAVRPTICLFEPAVINGSGATTYSWSTGSAAPSVTVFPNLTSTYTLTGTDNNGCSKTVTVLQLVSNCTGIAEQNGLDQIVSIYPNPSNGEFTITSETSLNISVVNEIGQLIKTGSITEKNNQLSVSNLANGIYFIIAEKDGQRATKKVVVNK